MPMNFPMSSASTVPSIVEDAMTHYPARIGDRVASFLAWGFFWQLNQPANDAGTALIWHKI